MYFLGVYFKNAKQNGTGKYFVRRYKNTLAKWNFLTAGTSNTEILQLVALACSGIPFGNYIHHDIKPESSQYDDFLRLEFVIAPHSPYDITSASLFNIFGSGIDIDRTGKIKKVNQKNFHLLPPKIPIKNFPPGTGNTRLFFLGYGSEVTPHDSTDEFDFTDPLFRINRFQSLFDKNARITDPVAFLSRLNTKAVRFSRFPAKKTLSIICKLFKKYLSIDTANWEKKNCRFIIEWSKLHLWQQRPALVILDSVRHMMDAFPRSGVPMDSPGLVLMDRPDCLCTHKIFPLWITLLDLLMPNIQFVITLSGKSLSNIPDKVRKKRLILPELSKPVKKAKKVRIHQKAVLLIDIDSRLPNLALMKLSRYFKEKGKKVVLCKKDAFIKNADLIFASSVFYSNVSQNRIKRLKAYYGESFILGGSGVDLKTRLPSEIEKMPADYSLYPELKDRAIGFITRGCPGKCPFCIVPAKEGKTKQVADLDSLLENGQKKLILLDDNILSHTKSCDYLEEMASRNLKVNFTQTLDIRFINREKSKLIRRIKCQNTKFSRCNYYFSLNDNKDLNLVREKYKMLGFKPEDNVEFVCMYGYNTTLKEDVERFRFIRSLPGAYVFVQKYLPFKDGPRPDLNGFFDENADVLIDELLGILYPQNMKSMETYYRWLSKLYAVTYGKLHKRLVDTLFKYNYRDRKGRYIATLAGTLPRSRIYPEIKQE